MVDLNGNGNNKSAIKLIIGIVGALLVSLMAWNFKAVQDLQVAVAQNNEKILSIRDEMTTIISAEHSFESDQRKLNTDVFDRITNLRVLFNGSRDDKSH